MELTPEQAREAAQSFVQAVTSSLNTNSKDLLAVEMIGVASILLASHVGFNGAARVMYKFADEMADEALRRNEVTTPDVNFSTPSYQDVQTPIPTAKALSAAQERPEATLPPDRPQPTFWEAVARVGTLVWLIVGVLALLRGCN